MSADQFIAARVSSETKARLRVLAQRQQLSESALLKRLIDLVLNSVTDDDAARTIEQVFASYSARYHDFRAVLRKHYSLVEHRLGEGVALAADRQLLLRAYFTREYAFEAAALFNPSIVAHPDQT